MHCWIFEAGKCSGKITSAELTETRKNFGEKSLYFVSDRAQKLTEFDLEHKTLKTSAFMEHHFLLNIYQCEDLELTKKTSKIKGLLLKDINNEVWIEDYNAPSSLFTQSTIKAAPRSALLALQQRRQIGTFVPISIARALQVKHSPFYRTMHHLTLILDRTAFVVWLLATRDVNRMQESWFQINACHSIRQQSF